LVLYDHLTDRLNLFIVVHDIAKYRNLFACTRGPTETSTFRLWLNPTLEKSREHDCSECALDPGQIFDRLEKIVQSSGIPGADLGEDAVFTGNAVAFLDLGVSNRVSRNSGEL
jgi:hypothetical protein